jgi:hypothetical protein
MRPDKKKIFFSILKTKSEKKINNLNKQKYMKMTIKKD